jgi:hypothetical protein
MNANIKKLYALVSAHLPATELLIKIRDEREELLAALKRIELAYSTCRNEVAFKVARAALAKAVQP